MHEWGWRTIIAVASLAISALGTWLITDHNTITRTATSVAVERQRYLELCDRIESLNVAVTRLDHRLHGNGGPGLVSEMATLSSQVAHLRIAIADLKSAVSRMNDRQQRGDT